MKLILKSLINNEACIDGARKRKWWISFILVFISLILAIIPTFVQNITVKGSSILSDNTYGIDYAFQYLVEKEDCPTMVVRHGKLEVNNFSSEIVYTYNSNEDAKFYYSEDMSVSEFYTLANKQSNSVIVFTKNNFFISVYNRSSSAIVNKISCINAYEKIKDETNIINDMIKGATQEETRKNLLNFLDVAFDYERVVESWTYAGTISLVNVLVVALMGFLVWVLTRGKNNPFRMFTFFDGMKIAMWAALAPAILTIPLGFLITRFSNLCFVMLLGIRVMWLTMKALRPDGTGYQEPKQAVRTVDVK